jgi:hypothetical protein
LFRPVFFVFNAGDGVGERSVTSFVGAGLQPALVLFLFFLIPQ